MPTTELQAGRELDALVAEKVFGRGAREEPVLIGKPLLLWGDANTIVPRFSTDIAAAWEVKQRVGEMAGANAPLWVARIAPALTMPAEEAAAFICRAALAAVED